MCGSAYGMLEPINLLSREQGSAGAVATGRYLTIVNVSCRGPECPAELAALMRSV
jgi:hypothetical protein